MTRPFRAAPRIAAQIHRLFICRHYYSPFVPLRQLIFAACVSLGAVSAPRYDCRRPRGKSGKTGYLISGSSGWQGQEDGVVLSTPL